MANSGNSSTESMPAPTSSAAFAVERILSSTPIAVTATMIGSAGGTEKRERQPIAPGRALGGGQRRRKTAHDQQDDEDDGHEQEEDRLREQRREVERDAGVDEEDRHEESERDRLDLAFDRLAIGLSASRMMRRHTMPAVNAPSSMSRSRTMLTAMSTARMSRTTRMANWPDV